LAFSQTNGVFELSRLRFSFSLQPLNNNNNKMAGQMKIDDFIGVLLSKAIY
jgi:hypothetical protein